MFAISVILCIALTVLGANTADIGDSCQLPRSSRQGVCQVINNCSPVIDEIVDHGLFPAQCGFRGRDQIVCCPLPSTWKATTTTPQPTRISQISKLSQIVLKCTVNPFLFSFSPLSSLCSL